jgi:CDP-6-deoxy-D-xylo-4-hexulose-3-dehydrase
MNKLKKGIFRLAFPFAEGEGFKRRPALALTDPDAFGDVVWAFISTKKRHSAGARQISPDALAEGYLPQDCYLHLEKTFTIHSDRIVSQYGTVSDKFWGEVQRSLVLRGTREFSQASHAQNRPGNDPLHPHNLQGAGSEEQGAGNSPSAITHPSSHAKGVSVPYAGRVFNEDEVEAAVSATLDFWLTLGEHGEAMQKELAATLGVKKSLLVNSGSSANLIAVAALTTHKLPEHKRIKLGDEVITCAAGFPTTVAPIIQNGAVPVFVDNDPITGNARMDQLEAAYVEGKTKAVMFAHTLGNPFDLATVCEFCHKHDLYLIEDNCDALGCTYTLPLEKAKAIGLQHLIKQAVRVDSSSSGKGPVTIRKDSNSGLELLTAPTGTFGDVSTQSFYPPHHLTMGEGGAVNIIRRAPLAKYAESFRDWGRDCWCPSGKDNTCNKRFGWQLGELPDGYDHKYIYSHIGYNVKPLDPQAAIGRKQIEKLPAFIEARKQNWEYLRRGLEGLEKYFEFSLPTHATRWIPPAERAESQVRVDSSSMQSVFEWGKTQNSNSNSKLELTGCSVSPSWFGFMLLVKPDAPFTKSAFASHLDENKVGNRMLFGGNLLRQPAFVQLKKDRPDAIRTLDFSDQASAITHPPSSAAGAYPGADRIMNEAIFIGTYPGLTKLQLDHMVSTIRDFVANCG